MTTTINNPGVSLFKNVNPYWGVTTGLAVWFLFAHTPRFFQQRHLLSIKDTTLIVHIVTAATVYLVCAHNCLITPSLHPLARQAHIWLGRIGLVSGLVSFSLGAFLAWSRLVLTEAEVTPGKTTLGFAIPITIGGILQMFAEVKGYRAICSFQSIRQELQDTNNKFSQAERSALQEKQQTALKTHIEYMLGLFVMACSIPAGMRLAILIAGGEDGLFPTIMIVLVVLVLQKISTGYVQRMCPVAPNNQQGLQAVDATSYNSISN